MGALYSRLTWSAELVDAEEPSPALVQQPDWGIPNFDSDWGSIKWGDRDDGGDEGSERWGPAPMVSPS